MKTTMRAGYCIVAGVRMAGADNNQPKSAEGAAKMAYVAAAGAEVTLAAAAVAAAAAEAEAQRWWQWQQE
jgi:hypothetical protein